MSHSALLKTFCSFGIFGTLLRWCESYLTDRSHNSLCNFIQVGSLLCGPSGFFVATSILPYIHKFISDLPRVVLRGNTIALYADDCKKAQESLILLRILNYSQQDVENLERWSRLNDMEFNIKKCKITKIIWKNQPFTSTFYLNNIELEKVDEFRDRGNITDHHIGWNSHVNCVVAKANKMLGFIKRTRKGQNDLKTLWTVYYSIVTSNLEYCSVV